MILSPFINDVDLGLHKSHEVVWLKLFYHPVFLIIGVHINGDSLKSRDHPFFWLWEKTVTYLSNSINIIINDRTGWRVQNLCHVLCQNMATLVNEKPYDFVFIWVHLLWVHRTACLWLAVVLEHLY